LGYKSDFVSLNGPLSTAASGLYTFTVRATDAARLSAKRTFILPGRGWTTPTSRIDFDPGTGLFHYQVTVQNITSATASFPGFAISQGPSSAAFNLPLLCSVPEGCAEPVAPGETCTVSVLASPACGQTNVLRFASPAPGFVPVDRCHTPTTPTCTNN